MAISVAKKPMKKLFFMARTHCAFSHASVKKPSGIVCTGLRPIHSHSRNNDQLRGCIGSAMPLMRMSSYQRSEYASGSRDIIPSVKLKYGSALKLSGAMMRIGVMRNRKISAQMK